MVLLAAVPVEKMKKPEADERGQTTRAAKPNQMNTQIENDVVPGDFPDLNYPIRISFGCQYL